MLRLSVVNIIIQGITEATKKFIKYKEVKELFDDLININHKETFNYGEVIDFSCCSDHFYKYQFIGVEKNTQAKIFKVVC